MTLANESRSKLNKDYVKPYDYTRHNSLYEIFKAPSLEYLYQLERAKEVRKTMWRKPFVRTKPNIAKNVAFLPVLKSISKMTKPHNKTPYELLTGKIPIISYIRPFGCHVTILNTIDHLGKFAGKSDEGFLVGYSLQSKAFRVYNLETKRVEENLHITFLENKPNVAGKGPTWLFDLDYLTDSMNYHPVRSENQANIHAGQQEANHHAGTEDIIDAGDSEKEDESAQDCFIISSHPSALILGDPTSAVQTRSKVNKSSGAHAFVSYVQKQRRNNHKDFQHCLFACFLSQNEPKKISEALEDESWVDAMQEELLQFKIQKVWVLVDLLLWERHIDKSVRFIEIRRAEKRSCCKKLKARLVASGDLGNEKGIDYDEVFTPVARIEAIRIFLAFASYMGFLVYQMDVKRAFLYGKIDEEKIMKSSDFFAHVYTASTPIETQKPLVKDEEASDVDVHLYRSMIGSLMYLTASRPDIMFAVCACSRFQVTPKSSHLSVVKRIFRYLKGKPKLGLWYPRVSSFDLESYSDSDYAGANLDRKSTTGGCQFLGRRLISWQCKKQTIVATSTTEAEYVAATSCCGQVLWIQNQMLDYGFNFMNTKIYIDNESTICIVKNPVYHSKTKYIAIRHHFIRDAYEKKLIQVLKIHTDDNVADILTKAFDVSKFQFLVVSIGMINP
ncbi:putative ribonuclease H-like domain-containing protein [Tanacetum coccineum]